MLSCKKDIETLGQGNLLRNFMESHDGWCNLGCGDSKNLDLSLRKKCPYSELFWSVISRIRTEYGEMRTRINPNTDTF